MGKIDGIIRDKDTRVVLARRDKHPLADLFKAIPAGSSNMPVFNMPPEMHHLLAIHIFDNLDCSPPREPLYKYREPAEGHSGLNGGMWVPIDEPDEAYAPAAAPVRVVDTSSMTDAELVENEKRLKAEKLRRKRAEQADGGAPA
jgi:hypothetical protein